MTRFFVAGVPVPKGSAKAFLHKQSGKVITRQDNADKQKPWASSISWAAQQHFKSITDGPITITLEFIMPRLKGHFGSGKNATMLKESAPTWHTSKPDLDKLIRCVKDALTGVVWKDDSQVAVVLARKQYGDRPGVLITVNPTGER